MSEGKQRGAVHRRPFLVGMGEEPNFPLWRRDRAATTAPPASRETERLRNPASRRAASPDSTWPGMEEAQRQGLARSIGVSNFDTGELEQLLGAASSRPVVNQLQFSPYAYRKGLLDSCRENEIALDLGYESTSAFIAMFKRTMGTTPSRYFADDHFAVAAQSDGAPANRQGSLVNPNVITFPHDRKPC